MVGDRSENSTGYGKAFEGAPRFCRSSEEGRFCQSPKGGGEILLNTNYHKRLK